MHRGHGEPPPRVDLSSQLPADVAGDWANAATGGTAAGWSYFAAELPMGGTLTSLQPDQMVGNAGASGFGGSGDFGTPAVIGDNADGGEYELFVNGEVNGAVVGTDVIAHPASSIAGEPYLAIVYTFVASDLRDSDRVTIDASFRNLVQQGDSVSVFVLHNDQILFEANGNDGDGSDGDPSILSEADGSFRVEDLSVAVGDMIRFVVGPNSNFSSDETAVRATIVPEPSAGSLAVAAFVTLRLIARRRSRGRSH